MGKKLYLMRHGETLFNTQGRVQGACDSPLTQLGIDQAMLAKKYFDDNAISFDKVIHQRRKGRKIPQNWFLGKRTLFS